jgi:uncharacterized protein
VLILLPPSEGKTPPATGDPADPAEMWLPQLAAARRRVRGRLVAMCGRSSPRGVADSLAVLGLGDGLRGDIARNADLLGAPAAPAGEVYTGVLYEALDAATLTPPAREWLDERAVVFSGLWGVVQLGDRVPAYRCPVGVSLPSVGGLTAYWKKALKPALDRAARHTPVLDLRSGAYAAMWTPGPAVAPLTLTVRVLHGGTVVSHFNKATKGRMVRALASSTPTPESVDELIALLRDLKFTVEERPVAAGRPRSVDVLVDEL